MFPLVADKSNGKEADPSNGKYKYAEVREYRVHAAIVYAGPEAMFQEDHSCRNGADSELCVP